MSDHKSDEYEHGFAVGVRIGVELEHILQDLIAELRGEERWIIARTDLADIADHYEKRLRQVSSD